MSSPDIEGIYETQVSVTILFILHQLSHILISRVAFSFVKLKKTEYYRVFTRTQVTSIELLLFQVPLITRALIRLGCVAMVNKITAKAYAGKVRPLC